MKTNYIHYGSAVDAFERLAKEFRDTAHRLNTDNQVGEFRAWDEEEPEVKELLTETMADLVERGVIKIGRIT
jgi:hypothetical protein